MQPPFHFIRNSNFAPGGVELIISWSGSPPGRMTSTFFAWYAEPKVGLCISFELKVTMDKLTLKKLTKSVKRRLEDLT